MAPSESPVQDELAQVVRFGVGPVNMVDRQRFADFDCVSQLLAVENLPAGELALAQWYRQVEIIAERCTVELVSSFKIPLGVHPAHQGVEVLGFFLRHHATP